VSKGIIEDLQEQLEQCNSSLVDIYKRITALEEAAKADVASFRLHDRRICALETKGGFIASNLTSPDGVVQSLARRVETLESAAKPKENNGFVSRSAVVLIERFFGQQGPDHDHAWQIAQAQADADACDKQSVEPEQLSTITWNEFWDSYYMRSMSSGEYFKQTYPNGVVIKP
jgi:hypothetical protein